MEELKFEIRKLLIRKLIATCPTCNKQIYGEDIDISNINTKKIQNWPFRYIHCHAHNDVPLHALTLYLDADFSVRAREVSDYFKIQE